MFSFLDICLHGKHIMHILMPILCLWNIYSWGPYCYCE